MALVYKPYQSTLPNKKGEKLFYPRLVKFGKAVDTQKIGELIAEKASLTPGDVHNTIRNLVTVMREQLLNSRTVKLDGLGTFTIIARAGGKGVKSGQEVNALQITGLRCRFTPEYTHPSGGTLTRALLDGVEYVSLASLNGSAVFDSPSAPGGNGGGGGDDIVEPIV